MDAAFQPAAAAESPRRIGEIFVERGFITAAQLEAALEVQRRTGARVGEILVEKGLMTRLDLASALTEYWDPHGYAATEPPDPSLVTVPAERVHGQREALAALEARVEELSTAVAVLTERLDAVAGRSGRSPEFPEA